MPGKSKARGPEPSPLPQHVLPTESIHPAPADISDLTVVETPRDLRRDLHTFIAYVRERNIKRAVRGNLLPKADLVRLAKLLAIDEVINDDQGETRAPWIHFIDQVALGLGLVAYDTTGVYAGYSSTEKSYPNNYMTVVETAYRRFLALPLAEQERQLLDYLIQDRRLDPYDIPTNEFYAADIFGRLDRFSPWGSATGIMKKLQFAPVRRFLLEILARCPTDVWFSTASLIAYLKARHPHFLIPPGQIKDAGGKVAPRFSCFNETVGNPYDRGEPIPEDAPDAFERIEGRYVERFLEGVPLLLGYVDVAYGENPNPHHFPSRGVLRAFRVKGRLLRSLRGQIAEPSVTVQPNLEIYVQAEIYPARVLAELAPLADVVSSDVATILKLRREKVAAALVQDERLNVVKYLEELSDRELPQNVVRELREWGDLSGRFTLYTGFALWEGEQPDRSAAEVGALIVEEISPQMRLVRSAETLYERLEQAALMPIWIKHKEDGFAAVPEDARSVFRGQTPVRTPQPTAPPTVEVQREVQMTLHFPSEEVWERVRRALADARCAITADRNLRTITYMRRYEPQIMAVFETLAPVYRLQILDLA